MPDPWQNTPDFLGDWEVGDVFIGIGAASWWPGANPGEWVLLREEEEDLLTNPLGYSIPGIAVRDVADPARGFPEDPSVDGFAAACISDPVTGNLWTADSYQYVTQFSGVPSAESSPTVRNIVSRITPADFVPQGGPSAPNALAVDGMGLDRRLWIRTYDYFGDFYGGIVERRLLGFDLPHVQGNPVSVNGLHEPPVTSGGVYKLAMGLATGEVEVGPVDLGLDGALSLCVHREYLPAVAAANPVNGCFNNAGEPIPCRPVESCNTPLVDEDLDGLHDVNDPTCNLVTDVEVCGNELDEDRDGIAQVCTGPTNTIQNTENDPST